MSVAVSKLESLVDEFTSRVAQLRRPIAYRVPAMRLLEGGARFEAEWSNNPGVYSFIHDEEVVYIGRAAKDSLRIRLWDQVRPRVGEWHQLVKAPGTEVVLYSFDPQDWYWVASLELFLLEAAKPRFNTRRC